MKKSFFLMAAAAAMFAACSETEVLNVAQESAPKAIAFETYAGKATRADAENSGMTCSYDLKDHHDDFWVWGYKSNAGAKVFNNVKVTLTGSNWIYTANGAENGIYWDKAAESYEFYAAAPATASFWTLNENDAADKADDYFTTTEFTVAAHNIATGATSATESFDVTGSKDMDLMIANKETVERANFGQEVQLDFMHILSRLNITVATSLNNVILKSLTVNGLGATASFDESQVPNPSVGTYGRWGSEVLGVWTAGVTDPVTYTALADQPVNGTAKYVLEALVMPQAAAHEDIEIYETGTNPYLTISYTINGEPFTASYNLAAAFGSTGEPLPFNEGWQNTLNINIAADAISFSGTVAKWKDTPKTHTVGDNY